MYVQGDTVVYRNHVCEVTDIRKEYFEGEDYLELHALFEKSLKLFVAVSKAEAPSLRPVMSRDRALALIDSISGAQAIDEEALRTQAHAPTLLDRHMKEEYDRHLKTFAPEELIPIMKSAYARSVRRNDIGRQITATDKKYLELAEGLLCDELSVSLGIERDEARAFLIDRMQQAKPANR